MSYQIAIDGPAGAGKSTIAKKVAKKLEYIYVDTGAMYRAMALYFIRNNILPSNMDLMSEKCKDAEIKIIYKDGQQVVLLGGEDVNELIRTKEVTEMASISSSNQEVREKMVGLQQKMADEVNVVMDGRDIGTCVLPNADVKIYLNAAIETRALRRMREMEEKGEHVEFEKIKEEIAGRDDRDKTRKISPLKKADGAVEIDTSSMTPEEVVEVILALCGKNK